LGEISVCKTIHHILQTIARRMSFVDIQQKSEEKRIVEIDYLKSVFILL